MDLQDLFPVLDFLWKAAASAAALFWVYSLYKQRTWEAELARVRKGAAESEKRLAELRCERLETEGKIRGRTLDLAKEATDLISDTIAQKLIDNPQWLDRFMDETGATYGASAYGIRISHFYYEKQTIAQRAVDRIEQDLNDPAKENVQFCLLLDSGTTIFPVFHEITKRAKACNGELWRRRVCIVTNNTAGLQYLMKNCKEDPTDDYCELLLNCFTIPGKPLAVYAAITGTESSRWMEQLKAFLNDPTRCEQWKEKGTTVETIGFITGNYMAREKGGRYYPVARGEGHNELKESIVAQSDKLFVLAPMMKFSFADAELLNSVNGFTIERIDREAASQNPAAVKYEAVDIYTNNKKVVFFTTQRTKGHLFERFGNELMAELRRHGAVVTEEFDVRQWIPGVLENHHLEFEREIPHAALRRKYRDVRGDLIWDLAWVRGVRDLGEEEATRLLQPDRNRSRQLDH